MIPETGVILVLVVVLFIAIIFYLHAANKVDELEEKVDDLYCDIQILEIREMQLKEQLKEVMTESDFLTG